MIKQKTGFTIIETVIIITVVAILSTIVALFLNIYMQNSRDSERAAKAGIIAEALEGYYDKNGQYPGCTSLSQNGQIVTEQVLTNIDIESLVLPKSPSGSTNSIICSELNDSSEDALSYVSNTSDSCAQAPYCLSWRLSYKKESNNETITIASRRSANLATNSLNLDAVATGTGSIRLTWNDEKNIGSYRVQRSSNSSFADITQFTASSQGAVISGLNAGASYYFRVTPLVADTPYNWSNSATATTLITAPSTVAIAASRSGTIAMGIASQGSCPTGATLQRQVRYNSSPTATAGSWSNWTTTNQLNVTTMQGHNYSFEARARCLGSDISSSWTSGSNQSSIVAPITLTPAAPRVTAEASDTAILFSWNSIPNCPTGSSAYYLGRSTDDGTYDVSWGPFINYLTRNWNTSLQGYQYTVSVQARCQTVHSDGPWSTVGAGGYIRPIQTPGGATNYSFEKAADNKSYRYDYTPPTCGPGTRAEHRYNWWIGNQVPDTGGSYIWSGSGTNGWAWPNAWNPEGRGFWVHYKIARMINDLVVPHNFEVRMKAQYACVNAVTGRASSYGPEALSPIYKT